ncbi:hypothetical protein D3OALGB2SA_4647 [Olavius algarvensis associated proteobacterium Delta 3]|nr:hypothetical protein D3OALGB2SA_4647 [Olavius algarvensis associated proteobacterium Delta 3]
MVFQAVEACGLPDRVDIEQPLEDHGREDPHDQQDGHKLDQGDPVPVPDMSKPIDAIHSIFHDSRFIPKIPFFLNKSVIPTIRTGIVPRPCPESGVRRKYLPAAEAYPRALGSGRRGKRVRICRCVVPISFGSSPTLPPGVIPPLSLLFTAHDRPRS